MRICPKCGYKDLVCWRNYTWQPYGTYCRIDELEILDSELAKKIKANIKHEDKDNYYQLTKSGFVHRIPLEYKLSFIRGHYTEKQKHERMQALVKKDRFQKKLLERVEEDT